MTLATSSSDWPDESIAAVLSRATGNAVRPASITRRVPLQSGTHPKTLVSIEVDAGTERWFFIKTGDGSAFDSADPRGGVQYEARVYSELLAGLQLSVVRYYGKFNASNAAWGLVLEGLPRAIRMSKVSKGRGLLLAARWLGTFHRQTGAMASDGHLRWLRRFDEQLLSKWCGADSDGISDGTAALRYLKRDGIPDLLAGAGFIIHGEFYGKNILYQDDQVYPVDWESAGVGPAELDLAMLIDGWEPRLRKAALEEYAATRWTHPVPVSSLRRLRSAEMLLHARWLTSSTASRSPQAKESRRLSLLIDLYADATR